MSTEAPAKKKSKDEKWNDWLGKTPAQEDEEKPEEAKRHLLCAACYPHQWVGPCESICGKVRGSRSGGPVADTTGYCDECRLAVHRKLPCTLKTCARRPWWKRIFA